jgi:hypothetical protein
MKRDQIRNGDVVKLDGQYWLVIETDSSDALLDNMKGDSGTREWIEYSEIEARVDRPRKIQVGEVVYLNGFDGDIDYVLVDTDGDQIYPSGDNSWYTVTYTEDASLSIRGNTTDETFEVYAHMVAPLPKVTKKDEDAALKSILAAMS